MLELGAQAPVFSPLQADTAVQVKGSSASQRAAQQPVLLGRWKDDSQAAGPAIP